MHASLKSRTMQICIAICLIAMCIALRPAMSGQKKHHQFPPAVHNVDALHPDSHGHIPAGLKVYNQKALLSPNARKPFDNRFDTNEAQLFYQSWDFLDTLARDNNITYMMAYGTLHGAHCAGNRMPWDDDADLWVVDSHGSDGWGKLQQLLSNGLGHYRLARDQSKEGNLKIWDTRGERHKGRKDAPWFTPFLDVSHVVCSDDGTCSSLNDLTKYKTTDLFPTRLMKLGRLGLSSPRDPIAVMRARYHIDPCTICGTGEWDHLSEQRLPFETKSRSCDQVIKCEIGTRKSDRANVEGNPICDTQQIVARLPDISLERRDNFLKRVGKQSAEDLNKQIFQELNSIEMSNALGPRRIEVRDGSAQIRVMFFNIERGVNWRESTGHLREANVILLNEADYGMARTDNKNVAEELATKLGKNYVQAIEFVELTNGLPHEINATAGRPNSKGYHCNAILSDFPLSHPHILRLPDANKWFQPPTESKTEVRLGSRMALSVRANVGYLPGEHVWLTVTHLDGTRRQLEMLGKDLNLRTNPGPTIFVGDLHTGLHSIQSLLPDLDFDLNLDSMSTPTWNYHIENGKVVGHGHDHTHLFGTRDLDGSNVVVSAPVGPNGELLSDSAFLEFTAFVNFTER